MNAQKIFLALGTGGNINHSKLRTPQDYKAKETFRLHRTLIKQKKVSLLLLLSSEQTASRKRSFLFISFIHSFLITSCKLPFGFNLQWK